MSRATAKPVIEDPTVYGKRSFPSLMRNVVRRMGKTGKSFLVPLGLIAVWQAFAQAGALPSYLVAPSVIVAVAGKMIASGELWPHLVSSLFRAYVGFALGMFLGVLLGLLAGISRKVETFFDPLISISYPIPKIAVLPIFMVLFGLGHASKIAIIAIAVFYPTFINAFYGAKAVNKLHIWAARNMGANPRLVFQKVIVPAALPQIMAGARVGLALSFIVLFASEMIGSRRGLGYLIIFAESNIRFDIMYVAIAVIGMVGFLNDRILVRVRKRLLVGQTIAREEVGE